MTDSHDDLRQTIAEAIARGDWELRGPPSSARIAAIGASAVMPAVAALREENQRLQRQRDEARVEANTAIPDSECAAVALEAVKAMQKLESGRRELLWLHAEAAWQLVEWKTVVQRLQTTVGQKEHERLDLLAARAGLWEVAKGLARHLGAAKSALDDDSLLRRAERDRDLEQMSRANRRAAQAEAEVAALREENQRLRVALADQGTAVRQVADLRDELDTARQERNEAREVQGEIAGDRDALSFKLDEVLWLHAEAAWQLVEWKTVVQRLQTTVGQKEHERLDLLTERAGLWEVAKGLARHLRAAKSALDDDSLLRMAEQAAERASQQRDEARAEAQSLRTDLARACDRNTALGNQRDRERRVADSADGVIRALCDALGIGYDRDPVLKARELSAEVARLRGEQEEWRTQRAAAGEVLWQAVRGFRKVDGAVVLALHLVDGEAAPKQVRAQLAGEPAQEVRGAANDEGAARGRG